MEILLMTAGVEAEAATVLPALDLSDTPFAPPRVT